MTLRWILVALLAGGTAALRAAAPASGSGPELLSLGLILLTGLLAGDLARSIRLPRVTGYLAVGMLFGPSLLDVVPRDDVGRLRIFEDVTLGLIALTAGGEFSWRVVRSRWRLLGAVTLAHVVAMAVGIGVLTWYALGIFPILGPLGPGQRAAAALLLGVIAVAKSPATTIAVITEMEARGELVDGVLGVTILKDLVLILAFAVATRLAAGWVGVEGGVSVGSVAAEAGLSLTAGVVLGIALGLAIRWIGRHAELLVVALALLTAEVGNGAHIEPLLLCMAAGFTARNLFPSEAGPFLEALERASPPLYIVFFALVGAGLPLSVLAAVGPAAAILAGFRLVGLVGFTWLPAVLTGAPPAFRRWGWTGFVAQAGLSLGLAARIRDDMPGFGPTLATLIVGAIVINQLVGPVLWRWGLVASGEAGRAGVDPAD